jgi:hypothetical protein
MHGVEFKCENKVVELTEFANEVNAQVVVMNYRGYSYSQ